ncbi:Uncharacterised protein [uncultured archaeon]|nr:Uncharacterised protein [uncultured archaeon]
MSEVQVTNANALYGIGTEARVRGPAWEATFQGRESDAENARDRPSKDWNEASFLFAAGISVVIHDQSPIGLNWGTTFSEQWSCVTLPKNRKYETTYMYLGAIAYMEVENVVCIRDLVGSELCISSSSGQKVFGNLRSAISQGKKVCISFENIKSLSPAFIESAIGQLYKGDVQGNIDEKLSFINISPGRKLIVDEVIREAKEYYSNSEEYVAKMKELFADD